MTRKYSLRERERETEIGRRDYERRGRYCCDEGYIMNFSAGIELRKWEISLRLVMNLDSFV